MKGKHTFSKRMWKKFLALLLASMMVLPTCTANAEEEFTESLESKENRKVEERSEISSTKQNQNMEEDSEQLLQEFLDLKAAEFLEKVREADSEFFLQFTETDGQTFVVLYRYQLLEHLSTEGKTTYTEEDIRNYKKYVQKITGTEKARLDLILTSLSPEDGSLLDFTKRLQKESGLQVEALEKLLENPSVEESEVFAFLNNFFWNEKAEQEIQDTEREIPKIKEKQNQKASDEKKVLTKPVKEQSSLGNSEEQPEPVVASPTPEVQMLSEQINARQKTFSEMIQLFFEKENFCEAIHSLDKDTFQNLYQSLTDQELFVFLSIYRWELIKDIKKEWEVSKDYANLQNISNYVGCYECISREFTQRSVSIFQERIVLNYLPHGDACSTLREYYRYLFEDEEFPADDILKKLSAFQGCEVFLTYLYDLFGRDYCPTTDVPAVNWKSQIAKQIKEDMGGIAFYAAPSGITWGATVGSKGRIGIYTGVSSTATTTTVNLEVWFWSKWSVSDSSNSYYFNANATSATTKIGSKSIKHTVSSGSGWSTKNQTKLGSSTFTYTRGASNKTVNYAAKFSGIETVGGTMTCTKAITVPAATQKYTVSYHANGGTGSMSASTATYNHPFITKKNAYTRTGYIFDGWNEKADGTGTAWTLTSAGVAESGKTWNYTYTKNITLYAQWKEKPVSIQYSANGGTMGPTTASVTIDKNGYVCNNGSIMISNIPYSSAIGGTGLANVQNPSFCNLERIGYHIPQGKHWFLQRDDGTKQYYDENETSYKGSDFGNRGETVTLKANWEPNRYRIVYHSNGGTGTMTPSEHSYDSGARLSENAFEKTGYQFIGWSTTVDGAPKYIDQEEVLNLSAEDNTSVDLYAVWKIRTYTNRICHWASGFKNGEGNNDSKNMFRLEEKIFEAKYNSNYSMDESRKIAIPHGFHLSDRFGTSSISGSWESYKMGTQVTQQPYEMSYDYSYEPLSYTITYDLAGGKNNSANPSSYNILYGVSLKAPSKTGYTFTGWRNGTTKVTGINEGKNAAFSSVSQLYSELEKRQTGNVVLRAEWEPKQYTVTYKSNGGQGSDISQTITYDTAWDTKGASFTKTGYIQTSWNTKADGTGISFPLNYKQHSWDNLTLYAQYKIRESDVSIKVMVSPKDLRKEHGTPSFLICMEGKDLDGNPHVYYQIAEFEQPSLSSGQELQRTIVFHNVPSGAYSAGIEDSSRYCVKSVQADHTKENKILMNITESSESGIFHMQKYEWQGFSDVGTLRI